MQHFDKLTLHKEVNEILQFFTEGIVSIFKQNLTGIYLTGSLSYGAFNYDCSDIDLAIILQDAASPNLIAAIRRFHGDIEDVQVCRLKAGCGIVGEKQIWRAVEGRDKRCGAMALWY